MYKVIEEITIGETTYKVGETVTLTEEEAVEFAGKVELIPEPQEE